MDKCCVCRARATARAKAPRTLLALRNVKIYALGGENRGSKE